MPLSKLQVLGQLALAFPVYGFLVRSPAPRTLAARRQPVVFSVGPSHRAATKDWALIFDCDGVILESEGLHRDAYNMMFEEFGISYRWSPEYYDELQNKVGGGIPKMRYYFGENGWPEWKYGAPPTTDEKKEEMLNTLQDRKTVIYKEIISSGTAQVRPGVKRLIDEARSLGNAKLAICSASTKASCLFVLDNLLGPDILQHFDVIMAGDDVKNRKPHPDIYKIASQRLGVPPERCVVVEDSLIGLEAALGAGMPCVITFTPSTKSQEFKGAKAVYAELGEGLAGVTAKQLEELALGGVPV